MQYRKLRIDYDEMQIDDFCLHPDEFSAGADPEDLIRDYIDDQYDCYRREGLLEEPGFPQMTM